MPSKLNLYALGQGGVNVVKSPIQLTDDECRSAQNAIFAPAAEGGLQKRGGLNRKNASALNSGANVLAISNVGLPNPFNTSTLVRKYLYASQNPGGGVYWSRSADGTTWASVTSPQLGGAFSQSGLPVLGIPPIQPTPGLMLYVDGLTNIDDLWIWDNSSDQFVLRVPPASGSTPAYSAGASGYHAGSYYFGSNDSPNGRVYRLDLITGQLTMIIGAIGTAYTAFSIASFVGSLFVGASDNNGGGAVTSFIYRCNPDADIAWTTDSAALSGVPVSMVNFLGNLYIGTGSRRAAESMNVYKRTPSGVYSTVLTDANPWNVTAGGQLAVFNNTLFAYMGGNIHKSTDGSAWSVDLDVFTTYSSFAGRPGRPVVFEGALYWPFEDTASTGSGRVLKRTAAGAWSVALGPTWLTGLLTVLELP